MTDAHGEVPLKAGTHLGPYVIVAKIGAGGMGEVYKAWDPRLRREVAVKVLRAGLVKDSDRLRRFEQEARAASALNHPNILTVHDFGAHGGAPYLVSELLEGENLRRRVERGARPLRELVGIAQQIAQALAVAHDRGIVHRDLKPENVFLVARDRVKLLDFGLAKLLYDPSATDVDAETLVLNLTPRGVVLGTPNYMSPEQVRSQPTDARSDLFAFGVMLYEMLTGKPPFKRASDGETMAAILNDEAPEIAAGTLPPLLTRIMHRCLEKDREQRFRCAQDLAFDLESVAIESGSHQVPPADPPLATARRAVRAAIALAVAVALAGSGLLVWRALTTVPLGTFQRLTFQRGVVDAARFASDGQSIVYGAAWDGKPMEVFTGRFDSIEARSLAEGPRTTILALSPTGEIALSRGRRASPDLYPGMGIGTLALGSLGGGLPHDVSGRVVFADFSPDGRELAVVRQEGTKIRLEYPLGKVIYETAGWIGNARVSPEGGQVAFLDYATKADRFGAVAVVDQAGRKKTLASGFSWQQGLAWSARGQEIWFTAARADSRPALYAVSIGGRERVVLRSPGALILHDIARDGSLLVTCEDRRIEQWARAPGAEAERDLSWLDGSWLVNIAADGSVISFNESNDAGGALGGVYIRKTDGSPPTRLANDFPVDLSRDGSWVLAFSDYHGLAAQAYLYPTVIGRRRKLHTAPLDYQYAGFFPDGQRILVVASEPGKRLRTYVQSLADQNAQAQAVTPEGISATVPDGTVITPDGKFFVARDGEDRVMLWPVGPGKPKSMLGFQPNEEEALLFPTDGRGGVMVGRFRELPMQIFRLDPSTGERVLWRAISPRDPTGVETIGAVSITPNLGAYAYTYLRRQSDLYLVKGLN